MTVNELFERIASAGKATLPTFAGATGWLNSTPLKPDDLRGKVVLVDFWTYTCINWIRTLPYRRAWAAAYGSKGLLVVGVHTPEFSIEHDPERVRRAARSMGVEYAIALDNNYEVWNAFGNHYWPALYLADAEGRIRYHHFGEGAYRRSERAIRNLLRDADAVDLPRPAAHTVGHGVEAPADWFHLRSPETYLGLARSTSFVSPGGVLAQGFYTVPRELRTNEWALDGNWTMRSEKVSLNEPLGHITCRFHARDLHLILAPSAQDAPVRFRVRLDGRAPREAHGVDVDEDGNGAVREPRLYQLIRQPGRIEDRMFDIEFLEAGASAFCFTFG